MNTFEYYGHPLSSPEELQAIYMDGEHYPDLRPKKIIEAPIPETQLDADGTRQEVDKTDLPIDTELGCYWNNHTTSPFN